MEDRELLELAAKAAGGKLISANGFGDLYHFGCGKIFWDPLNEDGDAFRLAYRIGIQIKWFGGIETVRRAIVSSAADIGRMMTP